MLSEKEIRDTYDMGKADIMQMSDRISNHIATGNFDRAMQLCAQVNANLMGLVMIQNILEVKPEEDQEDDF